MLETASAEGNEQAVRALYPEFAKEYRKVSDTIRALYDIEDSDTPEDDLYEG